MGAQGKVVDMSRVKVACGDCSLHQLCLPTGISNDDMDRLDRIIKRKRPIARGEYLFHSGDPFRALFAVRSGSVKTYTPTREGLEQVTGFHLPGELVGLDAINTGTHPCTAKALEMVSVCEIPFDTFEDLAGEIPGLQHQLLKIMSREIQQDQELLMLLGKKTAEERLASLLLSIACRHKRRGFSATEFNLSMSRNDIGNYLGLAVETVSRLFTRMQEERLLTVQRKHVILHDIAGIERLAGGGCPKHGIDRSVS